jgi:hypothetical protein
MIGRVLQHSQPYRSRTSGGIPRTESWHQPVGLQQTGLKSHIYTYQTAHDLSPKNTFSNTQGNTPSGQMNRTKPQRT